MDLQKKAILWAKEKHKGQFRKTGEPYFEHCFRVMKTIETYTQKTEILAAAVLHDTFEDTDVTLPIISKEFSPQIAFMVGALSKNMKNKNFDSEYRIQMYLNRFAKGCISDPWILFIKMADQIDNSSSFKIFAQEKQIRKRNEIINLFFPIYNKVSQSFPSREIYIYNQLLQKLNHNISI